MTKDYDPPPPGEYPASQGRGIVSRHGGQGALPRTPERTLDVPQRSPPFSRDAVGHAQRPPDAHLMGSGSPLPYARGGTHSAHLSLTCALTRGPDWRSQRISEPRRRNQAAELPGRLNVQTQVRLIVDARSSTASLSGRTLARRRRDRRPRLRTMVMERDNKLRSPRVSGHR